MITTRRRQAVRRDDQGLALLDVLLGMAIFALVAVVAAQSMGMFRERAYVTRALSDAKQLGTGIEAARIAKDAYPATVARNAADVKGVNLTTGSWVAGYRSTPESFRACVLTGVGSAAKAFAIFDSSAGKIVDSGMGSSAAECDGTGIAAPDLDGDGNPDPDDGSGAPSVTATAVPGETRATITWSAVTDATSYALYLDGAATPNWTGPELTTVLTGLAAGPHEVKVSAITNGTEGAKSAPASFTIVLDNDFLAHAHPVDVATHGGAPWTSADYTSTTATTEAAEEPTVPKRSRWWTLTARSTGTYTVRVIAASTGEPLFARPQVMVWETESKQHSDLTGSGAGRYIAFNNDATATTTFPAVDGRSYKIRVSTFYSDHGPYRLLVTPGPVNDSLVHASDIPLSGAGREWTSADTSNAFAGQETAELAAVGAANVSHKSMWWTLTADTTTTYTVQAIAPTSGALWNRPQVMVWETSSKQVGELTDAAPNRYVAWNNDATGKITFSGTAGRTYKIRVFSYYGDQHGPFRLRVNSGPANDNLVNASTVGLAGAGQTWTSPDTSNTLAGQEQGELAAVGAAAVNRNSMWWTLTAPSNGSYVFQVVAASDGTPLFNRPQVMVWQTNSTNPAELTDVAPNRFVAWNNDATGRVTVPVTAGQTYKIRVFSYYSDQNGPLRLRVTAP